MKAFKLAVQNALKSAGQIVSVLRINNIQVFTLHPSYNAARYNGVWVVTKFVVLNVL